MKQQPLQEISQDFREFADKTFLQSNPEIIAETCLVALTTISYILPRRSDLVPIFDKSLAENIDFILGQGSIILRARMSLLLGYYADMLFQKYPAAFIKTINFLISSMNLTKHEKVIALQSADTLNTIISDKDLIPRLSGEIPRIIKDITEMNLTNNLGLYFNFILDLVKSYHEDIGHNILPFLASLVTRILNELKNCHEKGEKNNLVINKCWNVIRQIIEISTFSPT